MKINKLKCKIFLSVYLFLLIFAPPIIPQMNIVLAFFTIIWLLLIYNRKILRVFQRSGMHIFCITLGGYLTYIFLLLILNIVVGGDVVQMSHYQSLYNRFIVAIITLTPCCLYINIIIEKRHLTIKDFFEILFYAGLIEAVTCLLAFLFPNVKQIFVEIMNREASTVNTWYITVRSFGFARTLVDVFGWGTGVIAGLALMYGFFYKKIFIIVSIFLVLSPLLNARTGLVFYAISIILVTMYLIRKIDIRNILYLAIFVVIALGTGTVLWSYIFNNFNATASWIKSGINEVLTIFQGSTEEKVGFGYYFLQNEWWKMPDGIRLLIGTGHSRYGAEGYTHSDFGYVNDIWAGGIIGVIMLYGGLFILFQKSLKHYQGTLKLMLVYVFISIFVFNIKGASVGYNSGFAVVILIIFFMNYFKNSKSESVDKIKKKFKLVIF